MNVKSDGGSRQHHYTTKSISIPYVPTRQVPWPSRGRVRKPHAGGQVKQAPPRTSGTITTTPCTKKWQDALGALLQSWNTFPEHQQWTFLERPVGGGNAEEEVIEVVDKGSVGLSLREHAISRSWCYSYLNCFKTDITERTVR